MTMGSGWASARGIEARYGPWVVVAGASEGIGASFSRLLADHGLGVVLVSRRSPRLEALAEEIAERGGQARVAVMDLSDPAAAAALIEATADLEIGLLVYNAGADPYASPFLDRPVGDWTTMIQRNCTTLLELCHHWTGPMVRRGHGGVLLVSSAGGWAGGRRLATYNATKAFDLIFGESLWAELGPHGVDALSLVLGPTDTPALHRIAATHGATLGDLADPDDVARTGLERLPYGPTWQMSTTDGAGPGLLDGLDRRTAVEAISAGNDAVLGTEDRGPDLDVLGAAGARETRPASRPPTPRSP